MELIEISKLKPHPQNSYYFDDLAGDKFDELKRSIETSGVTEAIVTTPDFVIISGHQRVRACIALGIKSVPVIIKPNQTDDEVLKQLIETNICQRGVIDDSVIKRGRRWETMKRLYGIKHGNNQHDKVDSARAESSEEQLAAKMGYSVNALEDYQSVADASEEVQSAVEEGKFSAKTFHRYISKLSEAEQAELIKSLPATEKVTRDQIAFYIDQMRRKDSEIQARDNQIAGYKIRLDRVSELENAVRQAEEEKTALESKMKQLANQPVKEVPPADYDEIKRKLKNSASTNAEIDRLYRLKIKELERAKAELDAERQKVRQMEADAENERKRTAEGQYEKRLFDDVLIFTMKCNTFLKDVGGYAYLCERMSEIPEEQKVKYKTAVDAIGAWATNVSSFI